MANKKIKALLVGAIAIFLVVVAVYHLFPEAAYKVLVKAERAAAGLEPHRVQVGVLRFEYLEGGEGESLVLLHGFGANKDHWTRIGRYLTPHFRVIAPDLTGFGESSPAPDGDYTIRAQATQVDALVRTLGIPSFHLGGSSMGGQTAGVYAAVYPEKVKSLLLIAPGGVVSSEPSEMQRRLAAGEPNPLVAGDAAEFDRLMDFVFVKRPFIPAPIKGVLVQEAMAHRLLNFDIFKQIRDSRNVAPLENLLRGETVPTLIIWGSQDRVLHVSGAAVLEAAMPNARVVVMKGVGHIPMIEKPKETAAGILAFLGR